MVAYFDPPTVFLKGTVTIPAGSTTATVTHGLGATPVLVWLQPIADSGKDWYVESSTLTSTQFTVSIPAEQAEAVTFLYGVS